MSVSVTPLTVTPNTAADVRLTTDTTKRARAIYVQTDPDNAGKVTVKKGSGGGTIGFAAGNGGSFTIALSNHAAESGNFLIPADYWFRGVTGESISVSYEEETTP